MLRPCPSWSVLALRMRVRAVLGDLAQPVSLGVDQAAEHHGELLGTCALLPCDRVIGDRPQVSPVVRLGDIAKRCLRAAQRAA